MLYEEIKMFWFQNPFRKSAPAATSVVETTETPPPLYEIKGSENYAATVMRIKTLVKLENSDRLYGIPIHGFQAIVDTSATIGDWGVVFPAETQLSDEFVHNNSLYRHEGLNLDQSKKGYFEDNRRVKAVKFRGNTSDCFFMPMSSLTPFLEDGDVSAFMTEGLQFDTVNGDPVCNKYVSRRNKSRFTSVQQQRLDKRVDKRNFPEHIETAQWMRVADDYLERDPSREVIVTQKLHGTSIRIGNVPVRTPALGRLATLAAKWLHIPVQARDFAMVYGSRKVVKDINDPNQNHYYGLDLYTLKGSELDGLVPKNYIVYGELVGWLPKSVPVGMLPAAQPIQKHYTYSQFPGNSELYVYRVAIVNEDGVSADLPWDGVTKFCEATGLKHVVELWRGPIGLFEPSRWVNNNFWYDYYRLSGQGFGHDVPVSLSADSPCDEGVCLRFDGIEPRIYKLKSPDFLQHETKMIDEGADDVETEESAPNADAD